ncbi:putative reverse transcriptase [Paratrimastix pyriformis]|uniref:Reverse transcriptase n=1 Tax=Paratrimastix pyriformis TaxID=342808 RepID=A0ABQ8UH12_9EUKA|nr:putative reverse transcriptase [Paratrimastix pyriformis]
MEGSVPTLYLLTDRRRHIYIGSTTNLTHRVLQHNGLLSGGAQQTRGHRWHLLAACWGPPLEQIRQLEDLLHRPDSGCGFRKPVTVTQTIDALCSLLARLHLVVPIRTNLATAVTGCTVTHGPLLHTFPPEAPAAGRGSSSTTPAATPLRQRRPPRPEAAALSDQECALLRAAATLTDPEAILEAIIPVLAQRTPARRPPHQAPRARQAPRGRCGPPASGCAASRSDCAHWATRRAAPITHPRASFSPGAKPGRTWPRPEHRFFATLAGDTQRPPCPISWQQLNEHHSREAASGGPEPPTPGIPWATLAATTPPLTPAETAALEADISEQEVVAQVGKAAPHTAPGSDGAGVDALKHLVKDPALLGALVALLRACWQTKSTPARWRASTAVLLLKRGKDPTAVSSWRHVALCDVLAKLYSGILAHRLTDFLGHPGRLAPSQHGFAPALGPLLHVSTLLATMESRRVAGDPLRLLFLDLTNAFGSVEAYVIRKGLRLAGIPGHLQAAILELYQGLSMTWRDCYDRGGRPDEPLPPISLERGVKQGDALSPVVFLLALDPLLRWLELPDPTLGPLGAGLAGDPTTAASCQAFADDLVVTAASDAALRVLCDRLEAFLAWARLRLNAKKCAILAADKGHAQPGFLLQLQGQPIPAMGDTTTYTYRVCV